MLVYWERTIVALRAWPAKCSKSKGWGQTEAIVCVSVIRNHIGIISWTRLIGFNYDFLLGLSSAKLLHEVGFDVLVLEARDRVGGRTFTKRASIHKTFFCRFWSFYLHEDKARDNWSLGTHSILRPFLRSRGDGKIKIKISKGLFSFWVGLTPIESVEKKLYFFFTISFSFFSKKCLYRSLPKQCNCIPCAFLQALIGEPFLWDP